MFEGFYEGCCMFDTLMHSVLMDLIEDILYN